MYLSPFINYRNCSLELSVAFRSSFIVFFYLKIKKKWEFEFILFWVVLLATICSKAFLKWLWSSGSQVLCAWLKNLYTTFFGGVCTAVLSKNEVKVGNSSPLAKSSVCIVWCLQTFSRILLKEQHTCYWQIMSSWLQFCIIQAVKSLYFFCTDMFSLFLSPSWTVSNTNNFMLLVS